MTSPQYRERVKLYHDCFGLLVLLILCQWFTIFSERDQQFQCIEGMKATDFFKLYKEGHDPQSTSVRARVRDWELGSLCCALISFPWETNTLS